MPGLPPRKSGVSKWVWGIVGGVAAIVVAIVVVVVVTSSHGTGSGSAAGGNSGGASSGQSGNQGSTGSGSAGALGTAFQVTGLDNYVYKVTLVKVDPSAQGDEGFPAPDAGTHYVGLEFSIVGVSGNPSNAIEDAFSNAAVKGTDGKSYMGVFVEITDGGSFSSGAFNPAPGATQTGWVPFQLPNGVSVASVLWTDGIPQTTVTWNVG